jgi:hypothetical protein
VEGRFLSAGEALADYRRRLGRLSWRRNMKSLISALILGSVIVAPTLVVPANAQAVDQARERALRDCSAVQSRDSHDAYDRRAGVMFNYQACMAGHGQPE